MACNPLAYSDCCRWGGCGCFFAASYLDGCETLPKDGLNRYCITQEMSHK